MGDIMYLAQAIASFEELKKYKFIITTKKYGSLVLEFYNHHFKHLFGIQYMNLILPENIKSSAALYRYLVKKHSKFEEQINLQIKNNEQLENRVKQFVLIDRLLYSVDLKLYKQHMPKNGSMLNVNFILYSEQLGYKLMLALNENTDNTVSPSSWMVESRLEVPYVIQGIKATFPVTILRELK